MGAQRATWQETFSVEGAKVRHKHFAATLLDLTKAFELVAHRLLAEAAQRHGYSIIVLRLTVAANRRPCHGVDGIYTALIVACCGITAGSGFA